MKYYNSNEEHRLGDIVRSRGDNPGFEGIVIKVSENGEPCHYEYYSQFSNRREICKHMNFINLRLIRRGDGSFPERKYKGLTNTEDLLL